MFFFLLLIALSLLIIALYLTSTYILFPPNEGAVQRNNYDLIQLDPFANPKPIEFTDLFLYDSIDFMYLQNGINIKNIKNEQCYTEFIPISTNLKDVSNYARDLYVCTETNIANSENKLNNDKNYSDDGDDADPDSTTVIIKSHKECLDHWQSIFADQQPNTLTKEILLWTTIFQLSAGESPMQTLYSITEGMEIGNIATPLYILLNNFQGYDLSKYKLLPSSKRWYLPVKNICDVFALKNMGYEFDSILEDSFLRWYHLILTNLILPTIKYFRFSNAFSKTVLPVEIYRKQSAYSIFPGSGWYDFVEGNYVDNTLKTAEGGLIKSINGSLLIVGKFTLPFMINKSNIYTYYDGKKEFIPILYPNKSIVVYIKLLQLKAYRRLQFTNMSNNNITLSQINGLLSLNGDENSKLLIDSTLESDCNHIKVNNTRRIIFEKKNNKDDQDSSRYINKNIVQVSCGNEQTEYEKF